MVPAYSVKVPRVSTYSGSRSLPSAFGYKAFTSFGLLFQNSSPSFQLTYCGPNPVMHAPRFGLFPFRSPLLWESILFFLFLRLLRCFSSPGSLHQVIDSPDDDGGLLRRVSPFRYLRISAHLQLPAAFRSLLRLSSALSAKASTLRSFLLTICPRTAPRMDSRVCSVIPVWPSSDLSILCRFISLSHFS